MSKSNRPTEVFHFPNSAALWHDGSVRPRSLGCQNCVHLGDCGGLSVGAGVFDCLTYCRCSDPSTCDNVCPNNPEHLVARSMEVQGFDLDNVPHAPTVPYPELPHVVPMLYHNSARARAPAASVVALSLYEVMGKFDAAKALPTRQTLIERFKLTDRTTIVLTGTHNDRPLERWWKFPDPVALMRLIRELDVGLITTPNFSLFDDVPRHDNLYNIKRIALVWSEVQNAGIACAPHLNARTDHDWQRWTRFLNAYPEITHVAFEFGTGAGAKVRTPWYVRQLRALAAAVSRPLHLITRGGIGEIGALAGAFSGMTVIDTSPFMRAQKRRRMTVENGKLITTSSPTSPGAFIDDLLDANIEAVRNYAALLVGSGSRTDH